MPGKHAPGSSRSFYLSLAKAASGAIAVVALIAVVVVVALQSGDEEPQARGTRPPAATASPAASPTAAPTAAPSPTRTPSEITVAVLNGTTRPGLARGTADRVRREGYKVVTVGNAEEPAERSTIFYRSGARADALALQVKFPEFGAVEQAGPALAREALLTLVIGADFPT